MASATATTAAARTREAGRFEPAAGEPAPRAPSVGQQKTFIVENASILNRETKLAILSIVMMEIGPSVVMETGGTKEVDIDLDAVTEANEEVLYHIYNIVQTRREALSQPAGAQSSGHASARPESRDPPFRAQTLPDSGKVAY
jgi:hypothetical protein